MTMLTMMMYFYYQHQLHTKTIYIYICTYGSLVCFRNHSISGFPQGIRVRLEINSVNINNWAAMKSFIRVGGRNCSAKLYNGWDQTKLYMTITIFRNQFLERVTLT